jgi:hypothetical protein
MAFPATRRTTVVAILGFVVLPTHWAFLARISRINPLDAYPHPFGFVGDERRQLKKAPGVLHAVVFAGFGPTTCTCRALSYPEELFEVDDTHSLTILKHSSILCAGQDIHGLNILLTVCHEQARLFCCGIQAHLDRILHAFGFSAHE